MKNKQGMLAAKRVVYIQLGITLLGSAVLYLIGGTKAGLSVILGGLVNAVPNAYFARKLFRYQGASAAKQIIKGFYQGEALKIALSVAMFAAVFKFCNIIPWVFFAAYIAAQMVLWFTPLIVVNSKQNRPESD